MKVDLVSKQRWRRGESRERLLQVALQAVAEVGPSAVSGRAVARDADVHHAQIQQMFGSVDELVSAAVIAERDRFIDSVFDTPTALPDPLAVADFPLFWRSITQVLLDPGPIDMSVLASGGPVARLDERLAACAGDRLSELNTAVAVAWAAAPLGALIFDVPLRRDLGIGSRQWPACWRRVGARLGELATVSSMPAAAAAPVQPTAAPRVATPMGGRQSLVTAAEDLLATRLETAVTGRALAAHASVNYGLVNHYFGSKSAVFDEALLNLHRQFLDDVLVSADHDVFAHHRPFLRAWASRLLGGRPVPDFELRGMEKLMTNLVAERAVSSTDSPAALHAAGDALAAVALQLGWTLLQPLPFSADLDRADPVIAQLRAVHRWLLQSPGNTA